MKKSALLIPLSLLLFASLSAAAPAKKPAKSAPAKAPKPDLQLQAQAQKIYYDVATPVEASIELTNHTAEPRDLQVEAWLEAGLDKKTEKQTQTVKVAAKSTATATFCWPAQPLGLYGYALKTRVTGGETPLEDTDYFTICDNYWNVALSSGHPIAYTAGVSENLITGRMASLRKEYYNGFEKFFWAPDDFADMTPEEETYYSGQARYHESTSNLKFMIAEAHRLGMQATTYGKHIGSGSAGVEFVRMHPEMVYRNNGRLSMKAKVRPLAYWDKEEDWSGKKGDKWQETNWIFYNMNKPEVVDYGSQEIARSAQMFGWDGVRFDGHFRAKASWQDEAGKIHKMTREETDAQTAANLRHMKEVIHHTSPKFYFGYNYINGGAAAALLSGPEEFKELCRGGGHIMNEYIGQAGDVNHPCIGGKTSPL